MQTATKSLLTVTDFAQELGAKPLQVQRLIARGVIKATLAGNGSLSSGNWRLLPETLSQYIEAGAPDLAMPPIGDNGWFLDRGEFNAGQSIRAALSELIARQVDPKQLSESFDAAWKNDGLIKMKQQGFMADRVVGINAAMKDILDGPPVLYARQRPPEGLYRTLGEAAIVGWLREAAEQAVQAHESYDFMGGRVNTLYSSPDVYEAVLVGAVARLGDRNAGVHSASYETRIGTKGMWHKLPVSSLLGLPDTSPKAVLKAVLAKQETISRLATIAF